MAFNFNATYGNNTAKVGTDTTVANGATLTDLKSGTALAAAPGFKWIVARVWGRITGDWKLQYRLAGANTDIGFYNAGGDNLDIPGLNLDTPDGAELRVTGSDAAAELYIQYAKVPILSR